MHFIYKCLLLALILSLYSCSKEQNGRAQGYVEGRYTYMATPVSGALKELAVARGSQVKRGDLLFALDEQPEIDLLHAAQENLKQAKAARDVVIANIGFSKLTYERYKILVPKNAIQQSQLDSARSQYDAALAQLAQSEATIASNTATLEQAMWTKNQKKVLAPVDGIVFDTYYRLGEYTIANQAVLSLLAPQDIKAIFYVQEAVLGGLRLGDKVVVHIDGMNQSVTGKITFISPSAEYTPPVIYSDATSPKLVYRIEAEFPPNDAIKLHPGQPVMVSYQTHG